MTAREKRWTDSWLLTSFLIAVLGGGALSTLYVVEKQRHALGGSAELSYLPKGDYLKVAVLGYRNIAADLLWLKAVQGLSGREQTREGYLGAYHAADVLTDLDPQFVHAYQYTGTVLGVVAGLLKESVALLAKGVQHNPTVWQLSFFLGYDYYYELGDPASAAKYFQAASLLPGAPPWLPGLAARIAVEANDPGAALEFLQRLYLQTNDEQLREGIAQRIREVTAERDIRELEKAVQAYRERSGSLPRSLDVLVSAGILSRIPQEPFGWRYELSPTDGSVKSPGLRERLRVYRR
jgi:tetratricopeptide (TPR) repeat protein